MCTESRASVRPLDAQHVLLTHERAVLSSGHDDCRISFNFGELSKRSKAVRLSMLAGLLRSGFFSAWYWAGHRLLWSLALQLPLIFGTLLGWLEQVPLWLTRPLSMLRLQAEVSSLREAEERAAADAMPLSPRAAASRSTTLGERLTEGEADAFACALADQVVAFPWQRGDILLVDNTRMMHDGLPGVGPRKLHVALLQ